MSVTRGAVYAILDGEREYQNRVWGVPHERTECEFLLYMQDYLTEAVRQATREPDAPGKRASVSTLETIRKITALGVACLEQHGCPERKVL